MKKILTSSLLGLLAFTGTSQEPVRFKEIGLNATPFVRQFLNFSQSETEFSPYMLTYEQRFSKVGFRGGVGINSVNNYQAADVDNNIPEITSNALKADFRAGVVFYKDLSEKWGLKYGLDMIYAGAGEQTKTKTFDFFGTEVVNTVSDKSHEVGLSPFLFVQYRFNAHFSLGTEILGRATYLSEAQKEESSQFPEFATTNENTGTRFNISAPTSLFFIFRF